MFLVCSYYRILLHMVVDDLPARMLGEPHKNFDQRKIGFGRVERFGSVAYWFEIVHGVYRPLRGG